MSDPSPLRPETLAIKAGRPAEAPDAPFNVPISPASALHPGDSGYARSGHAPWSALEAAIGALEGGDAVTFASGMGACQAAMSLFPARPVVVAPSVAYMDVRLSLARMQERGEAKEVRLVDVTDTAAVLAACDGADVLWLESPTNPLLGIADLPALCTHARGAGILTVVDNTLPTPLGQRPLDVGADVVVHSATKALGGHSDLLLGAAVTRSPERLAGLRRARGLDGATPGALEVFLCLRGLRTLPLRLERSQANALELAGRLERHPEVHEVRHPGLPSHPQHERAAATMAGFGFMLTLRVTGGAARADAFVDALAVATHATSLGAVETTLERRHRYPAERHVPEDLLRVSVGCEHVEDLWADLDRALTTTAPGGAA